MVKAIIFDFGNVIYAFDNHIFLNKIAKYTKRSVDDLHFLIYKKFKLPYAYESGLITSEEFYCQVVQLGDLQISQDDFRQSYIDIFTPIETTMELIKNLKADYRLGLLSNISPWHFDYAIKEMSIFSLFDAVTLSFEVKAMKPDEKIYYDSLAKLNLSPRECVYIDDIKDYAQVATSLGVAGINYISHGQLLEDLRIAGIKI